MNTAQRCRQPTQTGPSGPREWRVGHLTLSHGWHGRHAAGPGEAELLIPTEQPLSIRQGNLDTILRPPSDLVMVLGGTQHLDASAFLGWRVQLDLERLCRVTSELAEHRLSPGRCRRRLRGIRLLQPRRSPERELVGGLLQLLQLARSLPAGLDPCLDLLGLDRLIERSVILLAAGDLVLNSRNETTVPRGSKSRIIEELQDWIQANLHRPIQLEELVTQSGYSQRSLRSIFHERFGCGPVQWIRHQRLEQARRRLLGPHPDDSVSTVALACGYGHLSQFSRDFRALYGIRPSEMLREGRRGRIQH
ncbi:MAG: hypothetical protein RLZZ219_1211 [Cyanobacteriota bacterium]|jgi:AraC-like DNA-binding protein